MSEQWLPELTNHFQPLLHPDLVYASELTIEDVREYEKKMNEKTNEKVGIPNTGDASPSEDTTPSETTEGATMTPNEDSAEKTDPVN